MRVRRHARRYSLRARNLLTWLAIVLDLDTPSSDTSSPSPFRGERLHQLQASASFGTRVPLLIETICFTDPQPLHPMPALPSHVLSVVLDGSTKGRYRLGTDAPLQTVSLQPGTAYMLAANSNGHWGWTPDSMKVMMVHLPPELVHHVGRVHGLGPTRATLRTAVLGQDRVLHLLAMSLEHMLNDASTVLATRTIAASIARTLALRVLMQGEAEAPPLLGQAQGPLAAPVRRELQSYIDAHLSDALTVSDLADHVGMSTAHFSRLFKETVGLTPYQYVLRERVRQAQHLLGTTDASIADIALRVGFANQSHLTRRFRSIAHTTPAAYRKAVQDADGP